MAEITTEEALTILATLLAIEKMVGKYTEPTKVRIIFDALDIIRSIIKPHVGELTNN